MRTILTLASALAIATVAHAQTSKSMIAVDCTCPDAVGSLYATALRDVIARSPRYALTDGPGDKKSGMNAYVSIISTDIDPGYSSAIAVTLTIGKTYYVASWLQSCGKDKVSSCASRIMAAVDASLQPLMSK